MTCHRDDLPTSHGPRTTRSASRPLSGSVGLNIEGQWQERTEGLVENVERTAVKLARSQGHTWEDIGSALSVSRQAAWGRFAGDE